MSNSAQADKWASRADPTSCAASLGWAQCWPESAKMEHVGPACRRNKTSSALLDASCPFCSIPRDRIVFESEFALAFRDGFPVSPGHTLVIPKRHVMSLFEATPDEQSAIWRILGIAKVDLDRQFQPAGYNIGINDGTAAGQTVMHLHVHLIPRYDGDRDDARGGVRWVLPDKAAYWQQS
jgi:diadenosine tetraphosphate (Ap4A) HIT family hydrolase